MKKIFAFVFLFYSLISWSQTTSTIRTLGASSPINQLVTLAAIPIPSESNAIQFDYDNAGNQVVRKPIYLASPRPGRPAETKPEEPKAFVESDIYSDIKYYPNPTVEILYVKWKNLDEWFVNNIQVFNISGQLMGTLTIDSNSEQVEVDFRAYPTGMYELVLAYNDGKQKTLKIIKK